MAPRSIKKNEHGSVGIIFALSMLPIVFMVGIAIDVGRVFITRDKLQHAADAAAVAATSKLNESAEARQAIAAAVFRENASNSLAKGTVTPVVSVTSSGTAVTATADVPGTFSRIIGLDTFGVEVTSAGAADLTTTPPATRRACVLALAASGNGSGFYTNSSTITADCGFYANATTYNAFEANGRSSISTGFTCVAGGVDKDSDAVFSPAPITNCPPMADPFSTLGLPGNAAASCTHSKKRVDSNATDVLSPGVYCEGIDIGSSARVKFQPGIYIIRNGEFRIGSSAIVAGDDVFFYLAGSNSRFDWGSSAEVHFTGRTSGAFKGMLLWHNYANSNQNKFGCSSVSIIEGAVYSPRTGLEINSNGTVGASADWTVWVVKWLQLGSSSGLAVNSNYGGSATPMPDALAGGGLVYTTTPAASIVSNVRLLK